MTGIDSSAWTFVSCVVKLLFWVVFYFTVILKSFRRLLCQTDTAAIVVKSMLMANRFHIEMNWNSLLCELVRKTVTNDCAMRVRASAMRKPAKQWAEMHGAALI